MSREFCASYFQGLIACLSENAKGFEWSIKGSWVGDDECGGRFPIRADFGAYPQRDEKSSLQTLTLHLSVPAYVPKPGQSVSLSEPMLATPARALADWLKSTVMGGLRVHGVGSTLTVRILPPDPGPWLGTYLTFAGLPVRVTAKTDDSGFPAELVCDLLYGWSVA